MIVLKQKPAFTMIELVFVIVVLGILASLALPRLDADKKQEAADDILSQIRYTQHLALMDDKHLYDNPQWQKRFWQIMFASCDDGDLFYKVGSDDDMDSTSTFEKSEAATDPINGKPLYLANAGDCDDTTVSPNIFIEKKYGVTSISSSGACTGQFIGFDHLGRPHVGFSTSNIPDYSSYMTSTCIFTFAMSGGDDFNISIAPETGYAHIVGQNGS